MNDEELATACVPIAARLVATVRDYGPDDVAAVLAHVPDGRVDALCIVLAAMVDPNRQVSELLAWTRWPGSETLEYHRLVKAGVSPQVADTLCTEEVA